MNCAAIILAAGASTRLGQPKQLILFEGETLVARAQRLAAEAGCAPIVVVTGARFEEVLPHLDTRNVHAYNPDWATGMASSIRAGVESVSHSDTASLSAEAVLLMTCDQPAVTAEHLRLLIAVAAEGDIAASTYANRTGVPAAFPRRLFSELKALTGDRGAQRLLEDKNIIRVPLLNGELDIDTPEDFARMQSQH